MSEPARVLQMGPDPEMGGGVPAAIAGLLSSPLGRRYRLDVLPTYRDVAPLRRHLLFCQALLRLTGWSLSGRGRIVHIHATVRGSAYRKAICVLLARALRRRVVLQVHSGAGDIAAFRDGRGFLSLALLRAAFAAADAVLAVSTASAEALRRAGVPGEIEVVPNAAPLIAAFDRVDPADGVVRVAYLGGFANPAKGGDVLLEALGLAFSKEPRMSVTLAGPGELPVAGAELVASAARIEWVGWLEAEAKAELLRRAQIFVMPSRSEGLPMALLEAMGYGMAIVATAVGGIPELIDDGVEGRLVPATDSAALDIALRCLVDDAELRIRLGDAARRVAERYDADEVAERLGRVYAELF